MSLNPAHVIVVCLVLVVAQLGVVAVCRALVAIALGLQRILLFAGIVAACAAVFAVAAARIDTDTAASVSPPPAVVTVHKTAASTGLEGESVALIGSPSMDRTGVDEPADPAGPRGGQSPILLPDNPATGGVFAVLLISFLILAVAFSQLLSAVLPILIIVLLVPPQDRAALADLIAALGSSSKFGVRSAVRAVLAARKRNGTSEAKGSGDDQRA